MSVFRFGAARSPPRRPIVQGSEQSPFCTSPSQLQEVTLDPNMNTTMPFPGRSPGKTSPLRGHALKEYEEQLAHLKKENFNLKLRIYFLEERMGRMNADDKEDVIKKNIELRVEAESLRKDVSDKQELLCHASKAVELLEEQHRNKLKQIQSDHEAEKGVLESRIQELEKEIQAYEAKSLACAIDHSQAVDQLERKIKELELQVNQLGTSARDESERANQLDIDLQVVQQEVERLSNQCQGLEADLKERDGQIENLLLELDKKGQDLTNSNNKIKSLEEALSSKESVLQTKIQELKQLESIIAEKESEIEEKSKVLGEIQKSLNEKVHQIEELYSSLTAKDETIGTLESRLEKAKTVSNNLETKLETSLQEVNRLKEELWDDVEEKNKRIIQITEERDALSLEMEKQVQMLLKQLAEKEQHLEECEKESDAMGKRLAEKEESLCECKKQLEAAVCDVEKQSIETTKLEQELNDLRTAMKNQKNVECKEECQQTDNETYNSELKLELADKKHEIERLNAELRKRTTNLQELVNKELWDKNREIEKLQDRLNNVCERKEVEIVNLRQQIESRDFQLKILQDRVNQLLSQTTCTSPVVIKEVQPITLNNHLHIQQPDTSVPSFEDQVSSLKQQLDSSEGEKKYLCQRVEELQAQLHSVISEDKALMKSCSECTKLKEETEHAMAMYRETAEICTMLTQRLEELAKFLSSLLKRPEFLGALSQRRRKFLKQVVESSMELSRSITVSFSDIQETSLQMNSLSGLLTSASELNLSLFKLHGEEGEDETDTETSCNESVACNQAREAENKSGTTHEQSLLIQDLRSQISALEEQIRQKDIEISKTRMEQSDRINVTDNPNSGITVDHEGKPESESSLNSMTFYNSRHSNNANEKWPKPLPLSLRKEDVSLRCIESKSQKGSSPSYKIVTPRLTQSANTTPTKSEAAKSVGNLRIKRSSSANAVSGGALQSTIQHREYGVASLSESEAWSEPDRNVSMARIGLREDNLLSGSWCSSGVSGRGKRLKDFDISTESSEGTTREIARTPGKRSRGDAGDVRKLQNKIRMLEQLNETLRAELNILHQLTPHAGMTRKEHMQPLKRDISVNTSQVKLDKSTSIERLEEESSVTVPAKLLEQIRYQREKLESSLFHNDFIRRQLEHIFVTLASSQGGDIGDIWQKLKETTEELCAARAKVQELQTKIIELETQLKDSKSKVQQLENTVEQLQTTQQTVSLLKEQITDLETKLKEKDNEILEHSCILLETKNKYEEQLMETQKASEQTDRVKEELEKQLHESYLLLADSERRVQEAEQQLRDCEVKLQEAEKQIETMRNETSEKIKETELEIYKAEKRRNEAEIQVIEAKKQLQEEESKRYDAEWRAQELEEKLKSREGEYEKYFLEILDRKIRDIELRANLHLREAEMRLEQKELFYKAEAEKKVQEAEQLGSEFEAGLRHQIEEAEKQGRAIRSEGEKKIKELEEKFKQREIDLKKRIHDAEHAVWEQEAELRRQLDEASMKHSQTALERTRLANEKLHLEQELRRYEAREAELIREKKEAENLLLLSKDKLEMKILEIGEKKNDLERRVRDLEFINSELEQRLAKLHPVDNYHSHLNSSHMSGPYSSSFPYHKTDAVSSSSGLDTYSGDGGSLPSSIWSLPPGPGEDGKRKDDSLKGDSSSVGLSALSTLVLQKGFCRQRSEMSDYMSEEPPAEEYETLFTQTCSSRWFSVGSQHSANSGNVAADSIVPRNINSSPDLGIESDQGRFSSLETNTLPPPSIQLETADLRNHSGLDSDIDKSVSALRFLAMGDLEDENSRLLKENANLKKDLTRTRKYLEATLAQLTSSNQVKKQLEKAICRQLHKTHNILRQARREDTEGEDIKHHTTTVDKPK